MLQDAEHLHLVQIRLSHGGEAYLHLLYERMCVCVKDKHKQMWGWRESKSMHECAYTKHVYSKLLTLKMSWWCWQQQGTRLPQHPNKSPPPALLKLCWQSLHWHRTKLGNMCVPLMPYHSAAS